LLIESDKASVEVPAPEAGKIEKILVQAGDMVTNGQDFIIIVGSSTEADSSSTNNRSDADESKTASSEPKASTDKAYLSHRKRLVSLSKQRLSRRLRPIMQLRTQTVIS